MNKNKKNNYNKNQFGKMTIHTNSIQNNNLNHNHNKNKYLLKNMLNLTNSSNNKIIKDTNNKSLNFNSINNANNIRYNMSSLALYKKSLALVSPLLFTKKFKNSNISLNKGVTPMSFERIKTTSHKSSQKNLGNINYNTNFISPKNTLNNHIKNKNNAKSHANLRSPINIENNNKNKRKYNSILLKKKTKDEQENDSKVLNLKYKNYIKFNGLKKNEKNKNIKYKSYNKRKRNDTEKKNKANN